MLFFPPGALVNRGLSIEIKVVYKNMNIVVYLHCFFFLSNYLSLFFNNAILILF